MPIVDNILYGPQIQLQLPPFLELTTLIEQEIKNNIQAFGDAVWMTDLTTGKTMTYSQLLNSVKSITSAFVKLGLQQGDVIVILSANHTEIYAVKLAAWKLGATVCGLTPNMMSKKLEERIATVQPKFVFTDETRAGRVLEAAQNIKSVREVFVMGGQHKGCKTVENLLEDDGQDYPLNVKIDAKSMAWLVFSSGTTGIPKGVVHTYRSVFLACLMASKSKMNGNRMFMVNYMTNSVAMGLLLAASVSHQQIYFITDLTSHNILGAISRAKPHIVSIFPCHIAWLCQHQGLSSYDTSSVKAIYTIGASVNKTYEREIFHKLPNLVLLRVSYGLSETAFISANSFDYYKSTAVDKATALSEHIFGSSGRLFPNTCIKIIDHETGEILGPNKCGEICVQTPFLMTEYLNQPEETAKAIRDGWFHTGDKGYYDENENIFIVGRYKEMIKYQSVQVNPAEIEKHLVTHPAVKDVAVVGLPDETDGELPQAFVVLHKGHSTTAEELVAFSYDKLSHEEKLRGGVLFVETIPRNDSGKVLANRLREQTMWPVNGDTRIL